MSDIIDIDIPAPNECPFCGSKKRKPINADYTLFKQVWALLVYAYDVWGHNKACKNFDVFRHDLLALAGHYEPFDSINGVGIKVKSISYQAMAEEFKNVNDGYIQLKNNLVDVVLNNILENYSKDDLERCVLETMDFLKTRKRL